MLNCIYVIPHSGNFEKRQKGSLGGSASHIETGIEYLSRYYNVSHYILARNNRKNIKGEEVVKSGAVGRTTDRNKFKGLVRDLFTLISNHLRFVKHYRSIKRLNPDVIYERSEYLNFNTLIICKILKIPHFYEANWVHYKGIQQFYKSYFNGIAKRIEEWMYNSASHTFFIGNQNKYLNLKSGKWSITQNGVPREVVDSFSQHINSVNEDCINICVLANLMPHHRFDIFLAALDRLSSEYKSKVHVHLIGFHFERVIGDISSDIKFTYHGPKNKADIYELFKMMNIAVISGGPHYSSFMKLYDYGAAKLAVICPELENIVNNFSREEILFFQNENSGDLTDKIIHLMEGPSLIPTYGIKLYNRVCESFTWEKIFREIVEVMNKSLN